MSDGPTRPMGRLVLVSTPIGNLGDLAPRAVTTLAEAAVVCCEDSRRTGRLLQHAGITARRLLVVNDHTESRRVDEVLELLAAGALVALVTDAGTPGISDPGERLVRAAIDGGHEVSGVPGPAAFLMALVVSGLPTSRFVFEGFIPRKGRERSERIADLAAERRTVVLHEAPHRVVRTIVDLTEVFGGARQVAIARELTKLHEEIWRGTLDEACERFTDPAHEPRGEYVIVIAGAHEPPPADDDTVRSRLEMHLGSGVDRKTAVVATARELGVPRRHVYSISLEIDRRSEAD
jgi:16S rRNA (cytidine1402-2'-O)-methyltransferase